MATDGTDDAFAGKRVLVVEDEMIVAMLIEDILAELGAEVVGPATRNARALELLAEGPVDAAILDVNLGSETTLLTARELRARGIPFAFATGYGAAGVPAEFEGQPFLPKPFREADLREALARALGVDAS
jgi:CheY-like chemotaxis protein